MDRSQLLDEFVKLKRILEEYENKQSTTLKNVKLKENNVKNNQPTELNKSNIFLNLNKLKAVHGESTSNIPKKVSKNNNYSKLVASVYINPNFRKPESHSSVQVLTKPSSNQVGNKQTGVGIEKSPINFPEQESGSLFRHINDQSSSQKSTSSSYGSRVSKLPKTENKLKPTSNNHVIFVNPEFSSSSKLETNFLTLTSSSQSDKTITDQCKHSDQNPNSKTKINKQILHVNECRKRKISTEGDKFSESHTNDQKRVRVSENVNVLAKKIFLNPKFEKKGSEYKSHESSNMCTETSGVELTCRTLPQSSSSTETLLTQGTSVIPVLIGKRDVSNKFTSVSYPLCAVVGPNHRKQVVKKAISQRTRTRSTSLVTISTTKLVRRRRSSLKVLDTTGIVMSQPLFMSKTKLVRNVGKGTVSNSCIPKVKVKQINQKCQTPFSLAGKLHKSGRKSLTDSFMSIGSKPAVVTKIKSKNGKTLRLIRKTANTSSSAVVEKVKTQNVVNIKKMELRQQANRVRMCLIQSRLRRNQYSKINVPLTVSDPRNCNKNIYKKNNITMRKPLTKSALVGKKDSGNLVAKTQVRNPSDMTKFIKSKYRLVRKHSSNVISRYKLSQKIVNRKTPHDKMVQRRKLKWKNKSVTPKRRLTRKDLSLKKIGGVFYQCSRTTLAKNRPSKKQVSQLQNKGLSQASSERRQNRFCLDRNPRRKRPSMSGVPFVTSPSGMSWRRTNPSSARSILTQAKQKSIHLLTKKMKKNNEPCLFFHRYGQCSGHDRGTCVRLHDQKYVVVCKKFIQGSCTDTKCRLNHEPSCHNMPTCHHFLAGQCGRDLCPYPHIKVSDNAPICLDFLKGFCSLGEKCAKRHFEICPSFEKGVCARGKYCPYPHPKNKTGENLKGKFKYIKRKQQPPKEAVTVSTPSVRYFEDVNLQKENQIQLDEDRQGSEDGNSEVDVEEVTCLKKRPQLGELPSFIPLGSQSFQEEST